MVIADVGQSAREEIDVAPSPSSGVVGGAGANYGWNCREGFIAYSNPAAACASASGFTEPVFDYPHSDPGGGAAYGCSIIGGYVVRDPSLPDLYGRYLYTDYCSGGVRSLVLPRGGGLATDDRFEGLTVKKPTSFGEDSCGRVYVASSEGPVYRFEGASPTACTTPAMGAPSSQAAAAPRKKHSTKSRHRRLLLSAKRLGAGGSRFRLKVRLVPCRSGGGLPVQLSRNGKSFDAKHLDHRCRARFLLTVARPTPIRAFVRLGKEGQRIGSRQLILQPPRRP
jgi:hypothetical protein